jgi:hypothetical protein
MPSGEKPNRSTENQSERWNKHLIEVGVKDVGISIPSGDLGLAHVFALTDYDRHG